MQEYHRTLPLATGYFGLSSALYAFGGLIVVYGPAGGAWHINIEDEPRWYRGPATVVGAGLLEMDVILGNDDKFIDNITKMATSLQRSFVALAGTPISEIIGTDLKGFAKTIQKRSSIPVFMVPTAGSEPYPEGASKAYMALAKTFMRPDAPKVDNGVNVLGAIHLAIGKEQHLTPLLDTIEQAGYTLTGVLSAPPPNAIDPLEGVRNAPGAQLNIVVSTSGLELAHHMYAAYGMPYVVGMPVGLRGRDDFLALLRGEQPVSSASASSTTRFNHALAIGEPVLNYGLKHCLLHDFGFSSVDVVSVVPGRCLFEQAEGCKGTLAEQGPGDVETDSEQEIAALMNNPRVDCVIADPCYKSLLSTPKKFIPLPHIAMSARIHWDMPYEYSVDRGYAYLAREFARA